MIFRLRNNEFDLTSRALIMGILNVTTDSFSDGGKFLLPETALLQAIKMAQEGAAIIDIGGESTRPGASPVSEALELERVLPVIEALETERLRHSPSAFPVVSIDTYKAAVARVAVERGATIINDITGLQGDPAMMTVVKETGVGVIIMHMQGNPGTMQSTPYYDDVVVAVRDFFRQSYTRAVNFGIDPMCIDFDPGIGFGKNVAHNLSLLNHLDELRIEERPLVIGVSRKSFIEKIGGKDSDRDAATQVLTGLMRERGANIIRVHEVKQNITSLRLAESFMRGSE